MRLSGYNSNPQAPWYKILKQTMAYLYQHPHVPIMYSRKYDVEKPLPLLVNKGKVEVISPKVHSPIAYSDGDLAHDITLNCHLTTSTTHIYNGTIFDLG